MDNGASSYRRFLNGDESAFDEIIKESFDNLVFFIDRYVHDIHVTEISPLMPFRIWWLINIGIISR